MLNGIKNFAINRILRHVADNPKLNTATNLLALIPVVILAALNNDADWMKLFAGDTHEIARVMVPVLTAVMLFFCGKFTWLKSWLPVAQEIVDEAAKEIQSSPAPAPAHVESTPASKGKK